MGSRSEKACERSQGRTRGNHAAILVHAVVLQCHNTQSEHSHNTNMNAAGMLYMDMMERMHMRKNGMHIISYNIAQGHPA